VTKKTCVGVCVRCVRAMSECGVCVQALRQQLPKVRRCGGMCGLGMPQATCSITSRMWARRSQTGTRRPPSRYIPYVSIRQHASAYVSIRQHTSAYVRHPSATEQVNPDLHAGPE
jgi:hypothetical protein